MNRLAKLQAGTEAGIMDYRIIKIEDGEAEWRENANTANVSIFPWPVLAGMITAL